MKGFNRTLAQNSGYLWVVVIVYGTGTFVGMAVTAMGQPAWTKTAALAASAAVGLAMFWRVRRNNRKQQDQSSSS